MADLQLYKKILHQYPHDLRLEVILSQLINEAVSFEEIEIVTNSVFARSYHFDIERVDEMEYTTTRKKRLRFVVNRDGLYDALPEDLVHQPARETGVTKEKMLEEIKLQHSREEAARKFFLPYEQEFFRLRVKLENEENKFMFANSGQLNSDVLSKLWEFPEFMEEMQKAKLGLLMPVLHSIIGNNELGSYMVSQITGDEVEITEGHMPKTLLSETPTLKDMELGDGFVLGGNYCFTEPTVSWKIKLNEFSGLTDYMAGGKKAELHAYLANLIMPIEYEVNIELDVSTAKDAFILNEEPASARLGFVTYL